MSHPHRLIAMTTLCLALSGGAALAEDAALASPAQQRICMPSAITLCPIEFAARDRPAVRACLLKNYDKVAPACQAVIKTVQTAAGKAGAPTH